MTGPRSMLRPKAVIIAPTALNVIYLNTLKPKNISLSE